MLREDPLPVGPLNSLGGPTLRSDRLDAYYAIMRPVALTEWFAFTPLVGGRVTHYTKTRGAVVRRGDYTRGLGEVGADAVLRASGTFDYKNPQWKIDGLRHLVTPRLSYRYIPKADKGRARIPQIDRRARIFGTDYLPYLQPLGLGDMRNIDELDATNTLRLSIDNVVQTRDPVFGTRDLLVFNVGNDFRFRRRPGERDVSEIHTELALMPARWMQVDVYQSFAPQSFTLREFNSGITIRDGSAWSVRFGNNFLRQQIQDYSIDGRLRLTERFDFLARLHYDARRRRFNEQAYGIAQNLGNTWLISYTVSLYSGRRRESSFGFNVQVDTVRF
jgi:LPS-assembly protein